MNSSWQNQEKIRQQFNYGPYPRMPLEASAKEDAETLFVHNLVTPYYLRHRQVISTQGRVILDAGCGSGYQALVLAESNPGAKIVGIDLSETSVQLAKQRLQYHGFNDAEFYVLKIEDLPQLGLEFDYINCDEVLYLLPNPVVGLEVMKSVLKPNGLIRANLHSSYQRADFYRAQKLFTLMGLMDDNPEEFAEAAVVETMQALKDGVKLKAQTWQNESFSPDELKELLAMNFLFIGDTGFTIPQLFELLEQADLEFVSMVNWRQWDVAELFKDPANLPILWGMSLANASIQEKLHVYELLNPIHRLIDFWCTSADQVGIPVDEWNEADWQQAMVHLHPQLRTDRVQAALKEAVQQGTLFEISREIKLPALAPIWLEPDLAASLLPLWEGAKPIQVLAARYRQIHPFDPISLEPVTEAMAFSVIKDLLNRLDAFLYVLIEHS